MHSKDCDLEGSQDIDLKDETTTSVPGSCNYLDRPYDANSIKLIANTKDGSKVKRASVSG